MIGLASGLVEATSVPHSRRAVLAFTPAPLYAEGTERIILFEHEAYFDVSRSKMPGIGIIEYTLGELHQIARDLRRGGWAVRTLTDLQHIEVNPERMSGRPSIKGRRIEADFVGSTAHQRGGLKLLRRDYELSESEIGDAVRWWDQVSEYEAA